METVLEVKDLTKNYKKLTAVDHISFKSGASNIIGLVGPNGAGKTTMIKMILGLARPTSGEVFINGHSVQKDYQNAIKKVSGIVEVPAFYPNLTGLTNLELTANTYGIHDKKYISEIVEMLGISGRINDKVKKYSLGMKQRLGICRALINKPDLLILDEPLNGLDPDGIIQFRKLMTQIKEQNNCCIIISSHILSEIEKICDQTIFIMKGKEVELLNGEEENGAVSYQIKTSDVENLKASSEKILEASPEFSTIKLTFGDNLVVAENPDEQLIKKFINSLIIAGADIGGFNKVENSLEENYLKITKENSDKVNN